MKPKLDGLRLSVLWKLLLFNGVIGVTYWILIQLMGMEQLAAEFQKLGIILLVVLLALGNLTFFLLDKLLKRLRSRF